MIKELLEGKKAREFLLEVTKPQKVVVDEAMRIWKGPKEAFVETKKVSASMIVKILRSDDFGMTEEGGGGGEALVKKGKVLIRGYCFYRCGEKMEELIDRWTKGSNPKYFQDKYGIKFKLVDTSELDRGKMFGRVKELGSVLEILLDIITV